MKSPRMNMQPRPPEEIAKAVRGEAELTAANRIAKLEGRLRTQENEVAKLTEANGALRKELDEALRRTGEKAGIPSEKLDALLDTFADAVLALIDTLKLPKNHPGYKDTLTMADALEAIEKLTVGEKESAALNE